MVDLANISCVIPAYNAGLYIEEAVESVRAQTLPVQEIIVVDDVSHDDTIERVKRMAGVQLLQLGHNAGAPAARNRGAEAARGEILAFLDADDEWLPVKNILEKPVKPEKPAPEPPVLKPTPTEKPAPPTTPEPEKPSKIRIM